MCSEDLDRSGPADFDGLADLAVKIVSPGSRLRDRGEKFAEHELGDAREHRLLDPEQRRADLFRVDAEDRYQRVLLGVTGVYRSALVQGCWLKAEWQAPLPPLLALRRKLKLLD